MKVIQCYYTRRIAFLVFFISIFSFSQETPTYYIEVTTMHCDTDEKKEVCTNMMNNYLPGIHSDRIYNSVPKLHKAMNPPDEN